MTAARLAAGALFVLATCGLATCGRAQEDFPRADVAEVVVFVARDSGQTVYVGAFAPSLRIWESSDSEPIEVALSAIEIENGHRPGELEWKGTLLAADLASGGQLLAEVLLAPEIPVEMETRSHFRGRLVGVNSIARAELDLDRRGRVLAFRVPENPVRRILHSNNYPLSTCIVDGGSLQDVRRLRPFEMGGRTFHVCSGRCLGKLRTETPRYVALLDEAIVTDQRPHYPLDRCAVSGKPLGEVEDPVELILPGNRLVLLASIDLVPRALAGAAEIVRTLDAQVIERAAANVDEPSRCAVDGAELGNGSIHLLHGNRLIRLCGERCRERFARDPEALHD